MGSNAWVESKLALAIAIIATILATALSLFNIIKHATHYNSPRTQKYIFRILGVIPVYAICSCVSVIAPKVAVVFLTLRDVYEAFVVYSFFTLILEYAGGDYNCTERIKHLPPVQHPPPLCCLPPVRRDAHLLRLTKQGALQFVVVKPIMAALSLAALAAGKYYSTGWQVTLLLVYNTTYSIALYCLLLFYLAIRSLLTPFQPVQKFFAVKAIVFATFWQSVLIMLLPELTAEQALIWNNFILCLECVPFVLLLNHAFPYHEFMTATAADKRVLDSVRQMLSVGDVFQDAYHSFMPSYQDYVVARDDHDNPQARPKTFRARTFLIGNLDSEAMRGARQPGGGAHDTHEAHSNGGTDAAAHSSNGNASDSHAHTAANTANGSSSSSSRSNSRGNHNAGRRQQQHLQDDFAAGHSPSIRQGRHGGRDVEGHVAHESFSEGLGIDEAWSTDVDIIELNDQKKGKKGAPLTFVL